MRCFLAFELPNPLINLIKTLQSSLRTKYRDLRWVESENLHLTLHFLGEINRNTMDGIVKECRPLAMQHQPCRVRAAQLGVFGRWKAPAVLWLSLQGDVEPIKQLHYQTAEIIKRMGLKPEGRPFSPHITLARIPAGIREGLDLIKVKDYPVDDRQQFLFSVFTLYTSELRPQGPVYNPYSRFKLISRT